MVDHGQRHLAAAAELAARITDHVESLAERHGNTAATQLPELDLTIRSTRRRVLAGPSGAESQFDVPVRRVLHLVLNILKVGMPAYLIMLPAMALYGWFAPWPPGDGPLNRYGNQTPLVVGFSYQRQRSIEQGDRTVSSRSYILLPAVLSDPKVVTVSQHDGGDVTLSESRPDFALLLAWLILCGVGTWWLWFRRLLPGSSSRTKPLRPSV